MEAPLKIKGLWEVFSDCSTLFMRPPKYNPQIECKSFQGYKSSTKKVPSTPDSPSPDRLPGLSYELDQLFFIGFARSYCSTTRYVCGIIIERHSSRSAVDIAWIALMQKNFARRSTKNVLRKFSLGIITYLIRLILNCIKCATATGNLVARRNTYSRCHNDQPKISLKNQIKLPLFNYIHESCEETDVVSKT